MSYLRDIAKEAGECATSDYFRGFVHALLIATAANYLIIYPLDNYRNKKFPNISEVQQGYIAPAKLEIKTRDLDSNGEKEVLLEYKGISYLLRDEQGRPKIYSYKIKPALTEIIVQEEK